MVVEIPHRIAEILERLPLAVALGDRAGAYLGKAGQLAGVIGAVMPSREDAQASRWRFADQRDTAFARKDWPGARALRGEVNYAGMVGRYQNEGDHTIRVVSVPAGGPESDLAAVTFLQLVEPRSSGRDLGLENNLLDMLAKSISSAWTQAKKAS